MKCISIGAKLTYRTIGTQKVLSINQPSITDKIKGYYDVSFYRLQMKYIEECMKNKQDFEWQHPIKIYNDDTGYVWYLNRCPKLHQDTWWRPGRVDLDTKESLETITYLERQRSIENPLTMMQKFNPSIRLYPCFTFTHSES